MREGGLLGRAWGSNFSGGSLGDLGSWAGVNPWSEPSFPWGLAWLLLTGACSDTENALQGQGPAMWLWCVCVCVCS